MTTPWMENISWDIYILDEFGLFYRAFLTESMHLEGGKCNRGKNSTIMNGLSPVNISEEKSPCLFKGSQKSHVALTFWLPMWSLTTTKN